MEDLGLFTFPEAVSQHNLRGAGPFNAGDESCELNFMLHLAGLAPRPGNGKIKTHLDSPIFCQHIRRSVKITTPSFAISNSRKMGIYNWEQKHARPSPNYRPFCGVLKDNVYLVRRGANPVKGDNLTFGKNSNGNFNAILF